MLARFVLTLTFTLGLATASDSPVARVITLLGDLKTEIESEGTAEATTYDTFACFCKDSTDRKSSSIVDARDTIDGKSAAIGADTATRESKQADLKERKARHEELAGELKAATVRCATEDAQLEAKVADLTKAVTSLEGAIKKVSSLKPGAALTAILRKTLKNGLELADALNLINAPKRAAITAFIQQGVDPKDPEYKFHSQGVLDILNGLLTDFQADVADASAAKERNTKSCGETKTGLTTELDTTNSAMETLSADIDGLRTTIADSRTDLLAAEKMLAEDQEFLKELTSRCENEAKIWDQRSQQRANELEAISKAMEILTGKVDPIATEIKLGEPSLLERSPLPSHHLARANTPAIVLAGVTKHSFLQEATRLRGGAQRRAADTRGKAPALAVLREEGKRLGSPLLSALAEQISKDPFAKVKNLIQQLIERLLDEATQEATKKGFCDTEVGKALKDRDFRFAEVEKLSTSLAKLEVRKDTLKLEIEDLGKAISTTTSELAEAAELRDQQKTENIDKLKKAKEGLLGIKEAITILRAYYSKASRATVLVQQPEIGAPDSLAGAYKGNQVGGTGVIDVLAEIKSDFEHTIKSTTDDEKNAAAEFVLFDRSSKSDIAGKTTQKTINEQELEKTVDGIASKTADIEAAQKLVDTALKTIADLKPVCIDTGMTFAHRATQRDEEIKALREAVSMLEDEIK